jgi:hypothetical protein
MKLSQKQKQGLEFLMYAKTRQHYSNLAIENAAKTLLSMKKKRSPRKKSRSPRKKSQKRKSRSPKRRSKADKLRHAAQLYKSRQ